MTWLSAKATAWSPALTNGVDLKMYRCQHRSSKAEPRCEQMAAAESAGELPQLWTGAWDPHDAHRFLAAGGNNVQARAASLSCALYQVFFVVA